MGLILFRCRGYLLDYLSGNLFCVRGSICVLAPHGDRFRSLSALVGLETCLGSRGDTPLHRDGVLSATAVRHLTRRKSTVLPGFVCRRSWSGVLAKHHIGFAVVRAWC